MSHRPDHISGSLAETWDALYNEAHVQGVDPEAAPLVVKDESRFGALEALAAVGGATVETTPEGGKNVRLAFADEGEEHEGEEHEVRAAAKPHTFAGPADES